MHIAEAMVRWLAPILSFTAEEIWQALPGKRGDTVLLEVWHEFPSVPGADKLLAEWAEIIRVRDALGSAMEARRVAGEIGSSLDAELEIFLPDDSDHRERLERFNDELRFVFITSEARVRPMTEAHDAEAVEGLDASVSIAASSNKKCERCWHRRPDVGSVAEHPSICGRCADNVSGSGEHREFV